ncbi:MAG: hypothetical protein ACRC0L_08465, partial [Angustibacter sp.]
MSPSVSPTVLARGVAGHIGTSARPDSLEPYEKARIDGWLQATAPARRGLRVSRAGNDYYLSWHMRDGLWSRVRLRGISTNGSDGPRRGPQGVHQIREVDVVAFGADSNLAGATPSGAGWSAVAGPPGYQRSNTSGDAYVWTAPAAPGAQTSLALRVVQHPTGGGVARVSINGDWTAATSLPTAQEMVDAGQLQASQLTTGGGSINPTHRCYSSYAAATNELYVPLGEGFGSAPIVRVEHTGGFRSSAAGTATNQRIMVGGFAYSTGDQPDTGPVIPVASLATRESAWEYAISYEAQGSDQKFMGNYHGNEVESSLSVSVDGSPHRLAQVALSDGATLSGNESIVLVKSSQLLHDGNVCANVVTTYSIDGGGLVVEPVIQWVRQGVVSASYAMMALNGARETGQKFTRGVTSRWAGAWPIFPATVPSEQDYA